ncbi:MAG: OmpA family protein [Vicinamibacteria bacterium]
MYLHDREALSGVPTPGQRRFVPFSQRPTPPLLRFFNIDKFAHDKISLAPPGVLADAVKLLADHVKVSWTTVRPIGLVRLIGHTDDTGEEKYNVGLGDRRAGAVESELHKQLAGYLTRVLVEVAQPGPGETQPVADNRTAAGRAANRRVEVFIDAPIPPSKIRLPWPPKPPPGPGRSVVETDPGPYPWGKIPGVPPGKSIEEFLMEACAPHFPKEWCARISSGVSSAACKALEEFLTRAGGRIGDKQKEELRKQCRDALKKKRS